MPAKFQVNITRSAQEDVEALWAYIASDSPVEATRFIHELERQVLTLERFPHRCPLIPENALLDTEYRHLLFGNYRTFFRIAGHKVFVLRIIHGARLLDSSLFETP